MLSQRLNKVLCINDNEITLFILKRILDKVKFSEEVIEISDGLEALNYCRKLISDPAESENTYPGLIFLDLNMPVMDGWGFLDHFSKHILPFFKYTKVIIISNSIDHTDSEKLKQYHFVIDFISNPLSIEYLLKIKNSLEDNYLLPG